MPTHGDFEKLRPLHEAQLEALAGSSAYSVPRSLPCPACAMCQPHCAFDERGGGARVQVAHEEPQQLKRENPGEAETAGPILISR